MGSTSATTCRCSYGVRRVPALAKGKNFRGSSVVITLCQNQIDDGPQHQIPRRELILRSSELAVLGAIFQFSGKKPEYLGVQKNPPSLALCPATKNCVSTSESITDSAHYAPPWNYNPESRKKPISKEAAKEELLQVIKSTKPDNSTPRIAEDKGDYLRIEYETPILGLVDDVEFWFPPGKDSVVEYRSASRFGDSDFDANRKRIKALRLALEKKVSNFWEIRERKMRTGVSVPILVIIISAHLLAFFLAVGAERRRGKAVAQPDEYDERTYCVYDTDASTVYGMSALGLLLVSQMVVSGVTRCLCFGRGLMAGTSVTSWTIFFFIFSWVSFLGAEACLLAGSARNAYHTKYRGVFGGDRLSCATLRKGVFAAGAALTLLSLVGSILYYCAHSKADTGGWEKHQNDGVAMAAANLTPQPSHQAGEFSKV